MRRKWRSVRLSWREVPCNSQRSAASRQYTTQRNAGAQRADAVAGGARSRVGALPRAGDYVAWCITPYTTPCIASCAAIVHYLVRDLALISCVISRSANSSATRIFTCRSIRTAASLPDGTSTSLQCSLGGGHHALLCVLHRASHRVLHRALHRRSHRGSPRAMRGIPTPFVW